ncbi:hypothetical protein D1AOALGA4SA_12518 [Olavius algarvensis Delta 1 endosymbiont]|nr:hypothetical protein D1AOALGA4SA_12518 [Olavius algarvensis Delta 1 endosymbiont]
MPCAEGRMPRRYAVRRRPNAAPLCRAPKAECRAVMPCAESRRAM